MIDEKFEIDNSHCDLFINYIEKKILKKSSKKKIIKLY